MGNKRNRKPLTQEDIRASENLSRLYRAWKLRHPGINQDEIAEDMGFKSQGIVSQHLNAHTPLSVNAVLKWAELLGVKPTDIRPEFDKYVAKVTGNAAFLQQNARKDSAELEYLQLSSGQKELFEKVIEAVVTYIEEHSIKLKAKVFAKLIITVYIECLAENKDPTQEIIGKFIYLAT